MSALLFALLIGALVLFLMASFGNPTRVALGWLGLAVVTVAFLVAHLAGVIW